MSGPSPAADTASRASWSVGGAFLEALAGRRFPSLAALLHGDARLRALLPSGPIERVGAEAIAERFAFWFGQAHGFEALDASVGEVGGRVHLCWRLRVRPIPRGDPRWHLIEQQAYLDVADGRIEAIDVLCSGFVPDPTAEES